MIGASRRRTRGELTLDEAFRLHRRIAQRTSWDRRLLRGAVAALVVSSLSLALPVSTPVRAGLVALAFAVGAALPVFRQQERAIRAIRDQTGLAYETALEILARQEREPSAAATPSTAGLATHDVDPYGLRAAVVRRARSDVRGVRLPDLPAWWLPPVAVALGLLLLPAATPLGPSATSGGQAVGSPAPSGDEPVAGGSGGEDLLPPPEAPGRAEEPDDAGSEDEGSAEGEAAAPPGGDIPSQAPLSRFLDSLRERPQDSAGDGSGSGEQAGGGPQGTPPPGQQTAPQRAPQGAPQGSGPQEGSEAASGEGGEPAAAAGEPTDAESDAEGEAAAESAGDDGGGAGEQGPRQAGAGEPEGTPFPEQSEGEGAGDRGEGASGADVGGDEGGEGVGDAGGGPGAPQAAGALDEDSTGAPDLLPGVLGEGPESSAGTVRLPGEDEVELPAGTSFAPYRTAVEDALTEGDIPLSYQEIIRRYFR